MLRGKGNFGDLLPSGSVIAYLLSKRVIRTGNVNTRVVLVKYIIPS